MKKFLLILALILVFAVSANAQIKQIVVQNATDTTFYTDLIQAIRGAAPGSDIIVPSGQYYMENFTKELHFYGVGYNPDSTLPSGPTIVGGMNFMPGSANTTVTGFLFTGGTDFQDTNITITRCKFDGTFNYWSKIDKCHISECIFIGELNLNGSQLIFEKNIVVNYRDMQVDNFSVIDHNIFTMISRMGFLLRTMGNNNWITNNIFLGITNNEDDLRYNGCNNIIDNNIFSGNYTIPETPIYICGDSLYNNIGRNNFYNVSASDIFVNYSTQGFAYSNDYHLKDDCVGKGASTDGTDIGIYGTQYPFKDGGLPTIPRYLKNQIDGNLTNGKLHIDLKVEAQTR